MMSNELKRVIIVNIVLGVASHFLLQYLDNKKLLPQVEKKED